MLILALAGLLCLTLALLMFSFLAVVAFWDTQHRHLAIILVGLVYLVIGAVLLLLARKQAAESPLVFEGTLAELERDREMLSAIDDNPPSSARGRL